MLELRKESLSLVQVVSPERMVQTAGQNHNFDNLFLALSVQYISTHFCEQELKINHSTRRDWANLALLTNLF